MSAIAVREARLNDAGPIARPATQLGYASSKAEVGERLRVILPNRDDAVYLATDPSGAIVGWMHIAQRRLVMSDRDAQIEGLVVDEGRRRKGVAGLLVRAAERWALDRNPSAVRVRSNLARRAAHQFYRRAGYVEVKRQAVYQEDLGAACKD